MVISTSLWVISRVCSSIPWMCQLERVCISHRRDIIMLYTCETNCALYIALFLFVRRWLFIHHRLKCCIKIFMICSIVRLKPVRVFLVVLSSWNLAHSLHRESPDDNTMTYSVFKMIANILCLFSIMCDFKGFELR